MWGRAAKAHSSVSSAGGSGSSVAVLLVLLDSGGGMVVQSLRHQLQRQSVLEAAGLFDLGPLVLKPDFDLGLVEVELLGQRLPPLLRDVAVHLELRLQSLQLLGREGRARPLVLFATFRLFQFPCPWACSKGERTAERKYEYSAHRITIIINQTQHWIEV